MLFVASEDAAQLADALGNFDPFQLCTVLEGIFADGLQLSGQCNGLQRGAVLEGAGADAAQGLGENNARKTGAALKGIRFNFRYTAGQGHGSQRDAIPERGLANDAYAIRHGDIAARTGIGHQSAAFDEEFFGRRADALQHLQRRFQFLGRHGAQSIRGDAQLQRQLLQADAQIACDALCGNNGILRRVACLASTGVGLLCGIVAGAGIGLLRGIVAGAGIGLLRGAVAGANVGLLCRAVTGACCSIRFGSLGCGRR